MKIRFGTIADLADVQRLNQALFRYEHAQGFHDDVYNQDWPFQPAGINYFTECLKGERNQAVFIAEANGQPAGYLAASCRSFAYIRTNPVAEIENMFVEETHRGHGVGTALIDAFKDWALSLGAARLKVGAFVPNAPALAFYRKNGFTDFELVLEQAAPKEKTDGKPAT